jgi:hypothetical protein
MTPDFGALAAEAQQHGKLPVKTSRDIEDLGEWVAAKLTIQHPLELEYVAERLVMENASSQNVIGYMKALAETKISGDSEKEGAFQGIIEDIENADASSSRPGVLVDLQSLLEEGRGGVYGSFAEIPRKGGQN